MPKIIAPILIAPLCVSLISSLNTFLKWNTTETTESYRLEVSYDSLFIQKLIDSLITDTTFSINVINRKTYYWRVRAKNSIDSSRRSCTQKFAARIRPFVEVLFSPIFLPADSLKISYQFFNPLNNGNVFIVEITDTSGNDDSYSQLINITDTSRVGMFKIPLTDTTLCSKKYKVRVISTNPRDTSVNSNMFEIMNKPPKPIITFNNNQLVSTPASTYQWFKNSTIITGAVNQIYQPNSSGQYRCSLLNTTVSVIHPMLFNLHTQI